MKRGDWKPCGKRVPGWKTDSGFRLIRVFSVEHNVRRLKRHAERLSRHLANDPDNRLFRLRLNRSKRRAKEKALYQAQQPIQGGAMGITWPPA